MQIDLVYLWVDGSDPKWLHKKQQFIEKKKIRLGVFKIMES